MIRIIAGDFKGRRISAPKNLPVRPTTDFAKEAMFNILRNKFEFENIRALDLFCGTGNISYELASRGTTDITAVDIDAGCIRFVKDTAHMLGMKSIQALNYDVFKFVKKQTQQWDLIFADPPYTLDRIPEIPELILAQNILTPGGWLVVEHPPRMKFNPDLPLIEARSYGKVNFAIFGTPESES